MHAIQHLTQPFDSQIEGQMPNFSQSGVAMNEDSSTSNVKSSHYLPIPEESNQSKGDLQPQVEYRESGEKIDDKTAVLILLSISFGVGYLFLPLSFFVKEAVISGTLLLFNFVSGFISVYMLMDIRAQVNLGSFQEVAYYISGQRSTILAVSTLFALFFTINCSVYLQLMGKFTQQFIIKLVGHTTPFLNNSMPLIVFVEALILFPMCRVLNFQKFKILTVPILVTVVLMFMCLVGNLVDRISLGLNSDFCSIMQQENASIPSAEFGLTYANVIPSLCFAFGFQIYMLQVHKTLDKSDPNGRRGLKIGFWTLLIMFILYGALLLLTVAYQEPHTANHVIYFYDIVFNAGTAFEISSQLVVIIQLFCHTPFVFYIAQEQVLILIDEVKRRSMSQMIDEMKDINGKTAAAMYLTRQERQTSANNNEDEDKSGRSGKKQQHWQVTKYRLPHMTMERNQLNVIFTILYIFMAAIAICQLQWFINSVSVFGATCVPLSIYVIPGYYYSKFHKGYDNKKYYFGQAFAWFGMGTMVTYTALLLYSSAVTNQATPAPM